VVSAAEQAKRVGGCGVRGVPHIVFRRVWRPPRPPQITHGVKGGLGGSGCREDAHLGCALSWAASSAFDFTILQRGYARLAVSLMSTARVVHSAHFSHVSLPSCILTALHRSDAPAPEGGRGGFGRGFGGE
jgi:hypothetical protein